MRSYIEYCIHYEEFGQDLDFLEGKKWRKARKLVEECKQGLHPDIAHIEKVTHYLEPIYMCGRSEQAKRYNADLANIEWQPNGYRDEECLYDREEADITVTNK
tara:strand:+ start:395 stop:703 length:309 start_codon:yes stop_codon:yes gene_type:complete